MKKRYISVDGVLRTFPVKTQKGNTVWLMFSAPQADCTIDDSAVAEALEDTRLYKDGMIKCVDADAEEEEEADDDNVSGKQVDSEDVNDDNVSDTDDMGSTASVVQEYPEVVDINGAVSVLMAEPYNIAKGKLRFPKQVKDAMVEHNISFPNLEI